ncbi:MAG TPA: CDP-alcohol phosphatidyltransferase family protein [Caulobacter sp.]|nr:CDP-alcohol phosphatidyltransferase family protein [Caulobacter sp.]
MTDIDNRRPLKTRSAAWAAGLAAALGRARVRPNHISALSVAFAAVGASMFLMASTAEGGGRSVCFVLAGVCIQLRLLCNMLDGMVAVEHGMGSPTGPIWNELPDRVADVLFLAAAGYSVAPVLPPGEWLGWLASALALLTAYVRELGRGLGEPADFSGPMAKPHRMFALTVACLAAAFEPLWGGTGQVVLAGLAVIVLGSLVTVWRRTARLGRALRNRPDAPQP